MTAAGQLATVTAAAVVVLAGVAGAARYIGGRLLRLATQWHGIQLAVHEAARETARLAEEIRQQLAAIAARRDEDVRLLTASIGRVDDRLREHEQWHAQPPARRSWTG